jgi:uncharacterized membrane-anchored protein
LAAASLAICATQLPAQAPAPENAAKSSAANPFDALPWVNTPQTVKIAERAELKLNETSMFLDKSGTDKFLELTQNLPEENSFTLAPKGGNWFAIYSFSDMGYVKDDEKIDADALLKTMQENQVAANEERKNQGLEPLTVKGWAVPPHYDSKTKNLEYGIILSAPSGENVNYTLRMLGRRGVMDAALVTSAENLQKDLAEFRTANASFAYTKGEDYASYQEGDKVSEYGLAALVTGGAAAALLKGGLLKTILVFLGAFWKIIAVGVVAAFVGLVKLFSRRKDKLEVPYEDERLG